MGRTFPAYSIRIKFTVAPRPRNRKVGQHTPTSIVYDTQLTIHIWRFPEMGVPPVIIHSNGIFPKKNHPFWGYPHDY